MKNFKHHIRYWFPVYIYAIFIFFFSNSSTPPTEKIIMGTTYPILNYFKHFVEYSLFSILLIRASSNSNFKNPFLSTIIISILYAITDEIHQIYIPERFFSYKDIFADTLGILITQYIIYYRTKYNHFKF